MKKTAFSFFVALVCCLFILIPTSHAASLQSSFQKLPAHPNVAGGGCYTSHNSVVTIESCINDSWPDVNSDAYITIPSGIASAPTCAVIIYIEDTGGDLIDGTNYPCHGGKVHYGPVSSFQLTGDFETYAQVQYNGTFYGQSSPILSV